MEQVELLTTPIKSESDKKEYRLIRLKNGLKALLIQKDESNADKFCAVSLRVAVGSYHEPASIGGLAHFFEHMVFLGSEKYPEEKGFVNFVTANGGTYNATTAADMTLYYFSAFEEALDEGFDRFADMLTKPLLTKSAIQREREAVDSEFQMAQSRDLERQMAVLKSLFSDANPASQFNYGNLKSLKENITDDELHDALVKLFNEYVSNKMSVCLQSKKSLDEMQAMVVERFSAVQRGSDEEVSEFEFDKVVKPEFFGKIFYIKPLKAGRKMTVTWVLPQQVTNRAYAPFTSIIKIFENEGEGGLSMWLKERNLVTTFQFTPCQFSEIYYNRFFSLIQLQADMTDHGMDNIETVLEAIFSFVLMLKETAIEEHKTYFEQQTRQLLNDFKFENEESSVINVKTINTQAHFYDDINSLRTSAAAEFNEQAFMDVINCLNELRFNIMIVDNKRETFGKTERFFGTEYDEVEFPESFRSLWENRKLNSEFFVPRGNPFEVTNFDIKVNAEESPKYPVKIFTDGTFEVWHKLDDKFKLPKSIIRVQFHAGDHLLSIHNYLLIGAYAQIFKEHFHKKLSQAFDSNYDVEVSYSWFSIDLKFTGFSEKMELFVDMFFREFTKVNDIVTNESFELFKSLIAKSYAWAIPEISLLTHFNLKKLISEAYHTYYEVYKILDQITRDDVQKIVPKLFEQLKIKVLAQGNITKEDTMSIVKIIDWSFDGQPYAGVLRTQLRGYQLPRNANNVLRIKSLSPDNDNSKLELYIEIGKQTIKATSLAKMAEKFIKPKAFDFLRTQHQLGYSVGSTLTEENGMLGISLYVLSQERKNKFTKVQAKIVEFIEMVLIEIANISDEDFESLKIARIKNAETDDNSLDEECDRNWSMIHYEFYKFDQNELDAQVTAKLTKNEFIEFVNSFLSAENRRAVFVQVIGNEGDEGEANNEMKMEFMTEKATEDEVLITDIAEFHKNLFLYPELKTLELD